MKKALLFGITGMDGSYLAELLLGKGYEVYGVIRRSSSFNTARINHVYDQLHLIYGDLADASSVSGIIGDVRPDEIYNLGAMSHVKVSFEIPEYTADVDGLGALRILEVIRKSGLPIRFYQASSSELYGSSSPPQNEQTPFHPRSPYGIAKTFAYYSVQNYREAYGIHASNGILFNHESPRRGETFVTRKITRAVGRIYYGLQDKLVLGNLEAKRDWGFAGDFVKAMWLMLQQENPDDYVIATGEQHSVKEFLEAAFDAVNLDWRNYVEIDPRYYRPAEVDSLLGDASKARKVLGWEPAVRFNDLVQIMVEHDMKLAEEEAYLEARAMRTK